MAKNTNPKKTKSLIRWNAIVPFFIVSFVFSIYFHFFFHAHAKNLLEFTGTLINRAEVNIGSFRANIFNASFEFRDIQITNPKNPKENSLEIERVYFEAVWDALLRAKLVAEEASIEGITTDTLRKKEGQVLISTNNTKSQVGSESKNSSSNNSITDMANLTQADSIESLIQSQKNSLQTSQEIKKLKKQLSSKEKIWKEKISSLPNQEKIKSLERRLKKIKTSNFKNLQELQKSLTEGQSVLNEFNQDYKITQKTIRLFNSDFSQLKKDFSSLQGSTEKDIKRLEKNLNIPSLNPTDISRSLFQNKIEPYLQKFENLMQKAEKYMPAKKSPEQIAQDRQKELKPRERHKGRNYHFASSHSYPLIWIKKIKISAQRKVNKNDRTRLHGEIRNLTTNPTQVSQPILLSLQGDLPEEKIYGIKSQLLIDHRQSTPEQTFLFSVERYPTPTQKIADSPDVKLSIINPRGRFSLKANRKNSSSSISLNNTYSSLSYQVEAKNKELRDLLNKTMQGLPQVSIATHVQGVFPNWQWSLSSNIARDLQKSFKRQVELKIQNFKRKLRQEVENKVLSEKKDLQAHLQKLESTYQKALGDLSQHLNSSQKQVKNKIVQAKKSEEKRTKKKIQKELEKALKSKKGQKLLNDLKKGLGL